MRDLPDRRAHDRTILLFAAVLMLALLGYVGFLLFPGLPLPATGGGLILLAAAAGLASLFSPCSFPLLLTFLAREAKGHSFRHLFRHALAFTVGVTLFLLLIGVGLVLGATPLFARVSFAGPAGRTLRLVAGLLLISFGVWQVRGQTLNFGPLNSLLQPLWKAQIRLRRRKSVLGHMIYGFGYILAGFG